MERAQGPEEQPRFEGTHHVPEEGTDVRELLTVRMCRSGSAAQIRTSFHFSRVGTTRTPQSRSECPPKYFVPESFVSLTQKHESCWTDAPLCKTTSAPHLKGYCRGGGAKVESTMIWPPTACTLSA